MKRFHLIEIHEQTWCPAPVRDAITDYLQFAITFGNVYQPIFQHLKTALKNAGTGKIVDLCSGGGGAWVSLKKEFEDVEITLTDLFPNLAAFRELKKKHDLDFQENSVNAIDVPTNLDGFRTMFSAFHHFRPAQARKILRDAANKNCGIGIFEATPRNVKTLLIMLLTPIFVLLLTPKIRPFRWSRIVFTYLLPIVPLVVLFDGVVSALRTYTTDELKELTAEIGEDGYVWEIGEECGEKNPIPIIYLIGYSKQSD
ncbi:MAG: class I SAM-dependent methyltransferase [Pyrinomonadaceae bacterium]